MDYKLFCDRFIKEKFITLTTLICADTAKWCKLPYGTHKGGCPNYSKKLGCPPNVESILNDGELVFLVGVCFDILGWAGYMKSKHAKWSDKQCRCLLYWQPRVRRVLGEYYKDILKQRTLPTGTKLIRNPEGAGADITKMMEKLGKPLQWPPKDRTWAIMMLR